MAARTLAFAYGRLPMDEDIEPMGVAVETDEPVVGVAHVPGLRSILEESTATDLPLVEPADPANIPN
jgi:hypothetical protein